MKKKNLIHVAILGLVLILVVVLVVDNPSASANVVGVDKAKELINGENVFVINTHEPYMGEIEGTDLVALNWEDMASYRDELPKDKSTPILVYCRSGSMSQSATKQLIDLGYKNVYDLDGGMNAWQAQGNDLFGREIKEFDIEVGDWYFSPDNIEVNNEDFVRMKIDVVEGYHGIYITGLGISEPLREGEQKVIEFVANKKGTFNFFCDVPCGSGHRSMAGQIIVK